MTLSSSHIPRTTSLTSRYTTTMGLVYRSEVVPLGCFLTKDLRILRTLVREARSAIVENHGYGKGLVGFIEPWAAQDIFSARGSTSSSSIVRKGAMQCRYFAHCVQPSSRWTAMSPNLDAVQKSFVRSGWVSGGPR